MRVVLVSRTSEGPGHGVLLMPVERMVNFKSAAFHRMRSLGSVRLRTLAVVNFHCSAVH